MPIRTSQILIKSPVYIGSSGRYTSLHGKGDEEIGLERKHKTLFSVAGTLTHLHVKLMTVSTFTPTPPAADTTLRARVRKNGSGTDLALTISGEDYEATNDSDTIGVEPGDEFYIRLDQYGVGSWSYRYAFITLVFFPTDQNETNWSAQGGYSGSVGVSANFGPSSGFISSAIPGMTEFYTQRAWSMEIARDCILSDFRMKSDETSNQIYRVSKNEVATNLVLEYEPGEKEAYDSVHSVSCVAGDRIVIYRPTGPNVATSFSIKRTDIGYMSFNVGGCPRDWNVEPATVPIMCAQGVGLNWGRMVNECVFRNLQVGLYVAPGAGKSRTFRLVKWGGESFEDTTMVVTISDGETSGSDCHWVTLAKGDVVALKCTSSGNPQFTVVNITWGFDILSTVGLLLPSVTTLSCSERTLTTTKGNAYIESVGGYYVITRGFCYVLGTSGDPTIENDTVYEDGEFLTGGYSLDITGLNSGESYRIRAYVIGPKGIAYGDTVTCSVLVFNPASRVSSIRRVYRPGLYRMEIALGELGFEYDVTEVSIKRVPDDVTEEEVPSEEPSVVPKGTPVTPKDWEAIIEMQKQLGIWTPISDWPSWATRTTAPEVRPPTLKAGDITPAPAAESLTERLARMWKEMTGRDFPGL